MDQTHAAHRFRTRMAAIWLMAILVGGIALADTTGELEYEDYLALYDANLITDAMPALREQVQKPDCDPRLIRLLAENLMQDDASIEALSLYRRAAEAGDSESMYQVGRMYEEGMGTPASSETAFLWFTKAAEVNHVDGALRYAQAALANPGLIGNLKTDPIERLVFASDHGSSHATYILGTLYETGEHVNQNNNTAAELYLKAMDSEPKAKTRLASMLLSGSVNAGRIGINRSTIAPPIGLLREAQAGGDDAASAYLGVMLEYGVGTDRDINGALENYRIAESEGVAWAKKGRERLEERQRSISLFGMKMYGAQRAEIRERFSRLNVESIEHGGPSYFDAYPAGEIVDGAETMTIAYAPGRGHHVAEIAYGFTRQSMSDAKVSTRSLIEILERKYGSYERLRSSDRSQAFRWIVGKTQISLSQTREDRSVTVTYQFRPFADDLRKMLSEAQRQQETIGDAIGETL